MLKDRVEQRLQDLGLNQFEAAERAGRNKHYIYDFLHDKKKSIKGSGLEQVANALECSIDYLLGNSDDVGQPPNRKVRRSPPPAQSAPLPSADGLTGPEGSEPRVAIGGFAEADVFRRPAATPATPAVARIDLDLRFPDAPQTAFLMRGNSLEARGVVEGTILQTVPLDHYVRQEGPLKLGAIVVIQFVRDNGAEIEISAREIYEFKDRTEYVASEGSSAFDKIVVRGKTIQRNGRKCASDTSIKVLGVVTRFIQLL